MNYEVLKNLAQEAENNKDELIVCGGGHVGYYVVKMGQMLDFKVTLIDDREAFANAVRFPGVNVICAPFQEALAQVNGSNKAYFVLTTRGHQTDYWCLEQVLEKEFAYVGMLGSKRKSALLMEQLLAKGVAKETLAQIHTPIGLGIGAQTPAEISVSIASELIQLRSKKEQGCKLDQEVIEAILNDEAEVVATIIEQYGSAPRGVGAMLILKKDGSIVGTVGGGSVEKEVIEKAKQLAVSGEKETIYYPMRHNPSEQKGMICGGQVNVLIEVVER